MTSPWPNSETSMAQPCGTCWRCGGQLYALLVHLCQTSVRFPTMTFPASPASPVLPEETR